MEEKFEDYEKNARASIGNMIKMRYIYRKLLEETKIKVSASELKDCKTEEEKVRKENELLLDKLHAFLKENNTIELIK